MDRRRAAIESRLTELNVEYYHFMAAHEARVAREIRQGKRDPCGPLTGARPRYNNNDRERERLMMELCDMCNHT